MINIVITKGDFNNPVDGYLFEANFANRISELKDVPRVYDTMYKKYGDDKIFGDNNGGRYLRSLLALVRRK